MSPTPTRRATCTSVVFSREESHDFQQLVEEGDHALVLRDGDKAAGAYVAAMAQADENDPDLLLRLAAANSVRTRIDEAELCFREVLAIEPGNTAALRGLIAVHAERGQHEMAFALEDTLFVDLPRRARVFEMIVAGDRWWAEGHIDKAERRYAQASRLDPKDIRVRRRLRDIAGAFVVPAPRDTLPGLSA